MVSNTKKAISPVVATALLLVVAVVAVVGFQTWFNTYQSGLNAKVETESQAGSSISVERLEAGSDNVTVYLKNTGTSQVPFTDLKVTQDGSTICNGGTTSGNVTAQSVSSFVVTCTPSALGAAGSSYNVVVVTASGVFSETELLR